MINDISFDFVITETVDERVESLLKELELSVHWNRPIILFAVYGSEYVRRDMQNDLCNCLFDIGQTCIHIKWSDQLNQSLLQLLEAHLDLGRDNPIFMISGGNLSFDSQKKYFEALNDQRDFFVENHVKVLFWLTQSEIINLARMAPDFWTLRHQVVEFIESPKPDYLLRRTLESTWQGTGEYDDQIEDTDEKISFREALLTNLPESPESNSLRANMLLTLGVLQWRKGDLEKAEGLLEEAINLAVKTDNKWLEAECLNARALVFTSMGRVDQAIDAYKQAIRLLPDQIFAWNNLGNLCAKIGRNDEAIVTFSKAIECNPEDSVAWNGLGNVYKEIGYYDDAINSYRNSIQFTSSFAQPWNGLGNVYSLMGRIDEAIQAYEQSIQINKNYLDPLIGLGNLYLKQEKYRDAIKTFQRALHIDEKNNEIWDNLGVAQLKCNDFTAAEKSFKNSIRVDRTYGNSYCNLGIVYVRQEKYDQAIALFMRALDFLRDENERSVIWNHLGDIYRSINQYELAVQAYKKADIKYMPNEQFIGNEESAYVNGEITVRKKDIEGMSKLESKKNAIDNQSTPAKSPLLKAQEEITNMKEISTNLKKMDPPNWLIERTNDTEILMKTSPKDTAFSEHEQDLNTKVNMAPKTDATAWNEIGNEHFRSGNYAEAIVAYNKAVQKDPGFGMPYANMGLISLLQERFSESILLYKKSIQMLASDEDKAIAYNGLGNAYRGVGEYDNALLSFRKAAELDPYNAGLHNQMDVFKAEGSLQNSGFWVDLGSAFLDSCSFNEAITALNKAAELSSKDGLVYQKLGKAYAYSGKYAEAISAFTTSIDLLESNKDKADSLNHLGNAYRKLNNYEKAIEAFQKAVVLSDEGINLATRARFSLLSNCYAEKA